MGTILLLLCIICAVLLILIVLIQNPKGGGISSGFGSPTQLGGVKQTTEGIEKATWGFAIAIVFISMLSTPYFKGNKVPETKKVKTETEIPIAPIGASPAPTENNTPTQ